MARPRTPCLESWNRFSGASVRRRFTLDANATLHLYYLNSTMDHKGIVGRSCHGSGRGNQEASGALHPPRDQSPQISTVHAIVGTVALGRWGCRQVCTKLRGVCAQQEGEKAHWSFIESFDTGQSGTFRTRAAARCRRGKTCGRRIRRAGFRLPSPCLGAVERRAGYRSVYCSSQPWASGQRV